jgi:PAS domain S-box-containing protein
VVSHTARPGTASAAEVGNLLRNYVALTADAYFLHDPDGRILDVNEAACRSLGYTRNELLDLNVGDIEQRFTLDALKKRWALLQPGHVYRFDALHRHKNGSVVFVSGSSQRFDLSSGQVIAARTHPLTELQAVDAAAENFPFRDWNRYVQLQRAQTLAGLGIWQWDTHADQMVWDDAMCALLGFTLEDYPRTLSGFLDSLYPDSRTRVERAFEKTLGDRRPLAIDYKIVHPDGDLRSFHQRGYVADVDEQGKVASMYGIVQDITEQKRLEERIEQSEKRFRMLVEQSPDAIYLHDLQGNILDVSPGTSEHLAYTREELLHLNVKDIVQAAGHEKLLDDWRTMAPGKHAIITGINRRKDGSEFPVEVHGRRFDIDGKPRILALVRDISNQQSLARLMEIILRSTARHSGGDYLQLLVRELAEILQLKAAFISRVIQPDLRRLRIVAMWQDGDYVDPFEYDTEGTPCERVFLDELVVAPRDAQVHFPGDAWLVEHGIHSYVGLAFYDVAANPLGHFGIMHDAPLENTDLIEAALRVFGCHAAAEIERMQLQGALLNREQQLETLVAVNKRLNSELDVTQIMRALVLAGEQLTGATAGAWGLLQDNQLVFTEYQRGEVISEIDYRFAPGEGVPGHVLETKQPYLSNDPGNDPHVIAEVRDSLRFHNLASVPIINRDGNILGCFELHNKAGDGFDSADLAWLQTLAANAAVAVENAQLLAAVRASQSELEQRVADRTADLAVANRELESFSYAVSHDLRAPLRAIEGFSQVLLDEQAADLNEAGKDYLSRIVNATGRMKELIEALLRLSRIIRAPLARQTVNLSELVAEIADTLQSAGTDPSVTIEIQPDVVVSGDAQLLRAALTNLVENARKFSARSEAPTIRFGSSRQAGETRYYIQDNGVGFEMDSAEQLFHPFQRAHSSDDFEGLGIGLATVQRIIHRHGGRVWAEGQPGQGAIFSFTLPA